MIIIITLLAISQKFVYVLIIRNKILHIMMGDLDFCSKHKSTSLIVNFLILGLTAIFDKLIISMNKL